MTTERAIPRRRVALAVAVACTCAAAIVGLRQAGLAARRAGEVLELSRDRFPVYVAETTGDLHRLWERAGIRGRIVVHLGRFLHFVAPEGPRYGVASEYPLRIERRADAAASVSHRSFLWAALDDGTARELWNVLSPADFTDRFGVRWASTRDDVVTHDRASRRTITAGLPVGLEPVVLNVDASWFSRGDPAVLARDLLASKLRADLCTVSLSADSPDVTDADRGRAREFLRLLAGHADVRGAPARPEARAR